MTCVPYARSVTGLPLSGDAWAWWDEARGRFTESDIPAPGAVLVFQRTNRLPSGHLAVVSAVLSGRRVLVTQANWCPIASPAISRWWMCRLAMTGARCASGGHPSIAGARRSTRPQGSSRPPRLPHRRAWHSPPMQAADGSAAPVSLSARMRINPIGASWGHGGIGRGSLGRQHFIGNGIGGHSGQCRRHVDLTARLYPDRDHSGRRNGHHRRHQRLRTGRQQHDVSGLFRKRRALIRQHLRLKRSALVREQFELGELPGHRKITEVHQQRVRDAVIPVPHGEQRIRQHLSHVGPEIAHVDEEARQLA